MRERGSIAFIFFSCCSICMGLIIRIAAGLAAGEGALHQGMVIPILHRFSQSQHEGRILAGNGSSNSSDVQVSVVTLNDRFGQYFAVMGLGSPVSNITTIIDTGSELLWIQCQPCASCGTQERDPIFNPQLSLSYRSINCAQDWCNDDNGIVMSCGRFPFSSDNQTCVYNATYADGSWTGGALSRDALTIPSNASRPSVTFPDIVFGCGHDNKGVETNMNSSGVLGLDRANHSLVSQLGVAKFAICFPDRTVHRDVQGFLSFDTDHSLQHPPLQYTQLLTNNKSAFYKQFYYVPLLNVSAASQLVSIRVDSFTMETVNGGGTVIDTGTTVTSFIEDAYSAFRNSMMAQMTATVPGSQSVTIDTLANSFDTCFAVPSKYSLSNLPGATLHFEGGVNLELPPQNVWVSAGTSSTNDATRYCLAFQKVARQKNGAKRSIIGNFQMQDFLIEYDLANERIGFARTQCDPSPPLSSSGNTHTTLLPVHFRIILNLWPLILLLLSSF